MTTDVTSNSQEFTASASEQHATFPAFYSTVIITNNDTVPLWAATDGSTVTDAQAGSIEVPPGQTVQVANEQVRGYWGGAPGAGGIPLNIGGTAQQSTYASGHPTTVSFVSDASPTGKKIVISAQ